jgi:hypothetical protein
MKKLFKIPKEVTDEHLFQYIDDCYQSGANGRDFLIEIIEKCCDQEEFKDFVDDVLKENKS